MTLPTDKLIITSALELVPTSATSEYSTEDGWQVMRHDLVPETDPRDRGIPSPSEKLSIELQDRFPLAYRLHIPPLRERPLDLLALMALFLHRAAKKRRVDVTVSSLAVLMLTQGCWRNNTYGVREAIKHAVHLLSDRETHITYQHVKRATEPDAILFARRGPTTARIDINPAENLSKFVILGSHLAEIVPEDYRTDLAFVVGKDGTWIDRKLSPADLYASRQCIALQATQFYHDCDASVDLDTADRELLAPNEPLPRFQDATAADRSRLDTAWVPPKADTEPPIYVNCDFTEVRDNQDNLIFHADGADHALIKRLAGERLKGEGWVHTRDLTDYVRKPPGQCLRSKEGRRFRKYIKNDPPYWRIRHRVRHQSD